MAEDGGIGNPGERFYESRSDHFSAAMTGGWLLFDPIAPQARELKSRASHEEWIVPKIALP